MEEEDIMIKKCEDCKHHRGPKRRNDTGIVMKCNHKSWGPGWIRAEDIPLGCAIGEYMPDHIRRWQKKL